MPKASKTTPTPPNTKVTKPQEPLSKHDGSGAAASAASAYEEAQNDEIEALKAIYMDDYTDIKSKVAWSKAAEKSFSLRLHPYSDDSVSVELSVTLTATYPKSLPILHLGGTANISKECMTRVQEILATRPKQFLGEVMIHELANSVQDVLEDAKNAAVQKEAQQAQVPSLEQERAVTEAAAVKQALAQQDAVSKQQILAMEEEERELQRRIDEQDRRRKEGMLRRAREASADDDPSSKVAGSPQQVTFDQRITYRDETGNDIAFHRVSLLDRMPGAYDGYSVFRTVSVSEKPLIAFLKRVDLEEPTSKRTILDLETLLEQLKRLRHPNLVALLDFKVEHSGPSWRFELLLENANHGSLADMLDIVGTLPAPKTRIFSIEILQALDYLHRNGVVHGQLRPANVMLHRSQSGATTVRLSDGGYKDLISTLTPQSSRERPTRKSAWLAPELAVSNKPQKSRKSDVYDFGILLVQILFGISICETFSSPDHLMRAMDLSNALEDLLDDLFLSDPKARPSAFDVTPYEFFRVDAPIQIQSPAIVGARSMAATPLPARVRHESSANVVLSTRYLSEWDEIGRLGKGGYGEVVKSRNKLDGRVYAIKKITNKTPVELSQVLSEVYLLATLNHPYVVRYYTAWPEDDAVHGDDESSDNVTSTSTNPFFGAVDGRASPSFSKSAGGLDFISSSGYPKVEFGYDDDDDNEDAVISDDDDDDDDTTDDDDGDSPLVPRVISPQHVTRVRTASRPAVRSTLYIQMEYCERLTLRDIIRNDISKDSEEIWRLFRQALEGLVHIHGHGIIHRDLKPENIFIDSSNNPRIGDFGLATSGQYSRNDRVVTSHPTESDMTHNVGTTFYVAPELLGKGNSSYTDKIDMYSLGIILFEMCHHISTGMERMLELTALRQKDHAMPQDLRTAGKVLQRDIIETLISHKPSVRPTSAELLRSGKIPVRIEDETVRLALEGLADESSPYHHKMMSALFSKSTEQDLKSQALRSQIWDISDKEVGQVPSEDYLMLQGIVRDRLTATFRRHGGIETSRKGLLLPRSDIYQNKNVFRLLDASGTLVQLPYDLTLPFARMLARHAAVPERNFAFGTVYRDPFTNGAPRSSQEADFDLVTHDGKDLALREAEVVKVMDEIIDDIPPLSTTSMCFHVSHAALLDMIMEFCRISKDTRPSVKEVLGKVNIAHFTWAKIRTELRGPSIGVSSTSLDELARFDFRDSPDKVFTKLQEIFAGSEYITRLHEVFIHLSGFFEYLKRLQVVRKVYVSPLSSVNDSFYRGGIMFQCLFDKKKKAVLAAGGRYDALIETQRSRTDAEPVPQAVGINIAIDTIVAAMVRHQSAVTTNPVFLKSAENSHDHRWPVRRCDVLVASFDAQVARNTGVRLVAELWEHDVSAELAADTGSPEELLNRYGKDRHSWIVIIRHESLTSGRAELKVKSMDKGEDFDVRSTELLSFLRVEVRERDQREGANNRARHVRKPSHAGGGDEDKAEVHVMVSNHKTKKSNKMRIVESARAAAQKVLSLSSGAPIAAIEIGSDTFEKIRDTRLSDPESWRRAIQDVPLNERAYLREVQEEIENLKAGHGDEHSSCFVYNFRTGACIYYDMRS